MKTFRSLHALVLAGIALWFVGCSDTSAVSHSEPPSPVLDLGPSAMGFDLGDDTLKIQWSGSRLTVDTEGDVERDSLAFAWKLPGLDEWHPMGNTVSLAQLPLSIDVSFSGTVTADFQITWIRSDGTRVVADSACDALTAYTIAAPGSSSSQGSSSSSSTVSSSSSAIQVPISAGKWTGYYSSSSATGIYAFNLLADGTFSERFNLDCTEYTGSWTQVSSAFVLTRTRKIPGTVLTGGACGNWSNAGEALSGPPVTYPVEFLTTDGSEMRLTVPDVGTLELFWAN